ncbi:MAG TPA: DKNYY domain-containing protein [Chitinophagaceae bacterium]|nr:DKNYY domain-containing protein [Chitinophagaceae bacterium]
MKEGNLRKYLKEEYYLQDNDGNIYFKSFNTGKIELLNGVDIKSFKLLTNFYSCDKNKIFSESKLLKENYSTYTDYKSYGYFKIDNSLYWYGKKIQNDFKEELILISEHFFTDGKNLFVNGKRFPFEKESFIILNKFYAKDKSTVFHSDEIISEADPSTFKVLYEYEGLSKDILAKYSFIKDSGYSSWAHDKKHVYYCEEIFLKGIIDAASTVVIDIHILRDKNHVYYFDKIIDEADSNSFQPILNLNKKTYDNIGLSTPFYRDNQNIFYLQEHASNENKDQIIPIKKLKQKQRKTVLQELLGHSKELGLKENEILMIKNFL